MPETSVQHRDDQTRPTRLARRSEGPETSQQGTPGVCSPERFSGYVPALESMRYQPIFELATMECTGAEALVRFRSFEGLGAMDQGPTTETTIRRAEESGEMPELGRRILQICANDWWRVMHRGWRLSVNVSPAELASPGYASSFLETLPHRARVEVEITETSNVSLSSAALTNLSELRQAGVTVAIDDVGEGANDVQRVLDIPCDRLKLSYRMTNGLGRRTGTESRIAEILEIANDLGVAVTAEGVETLEQLTALRSAGCDRAQGYLLGTPTSIEKLFSVSKARVSGSLACRRALHTQVLA